MYKRRTALATFMSRPRRAKRARVAAPKRSRSRISRSLAMRAAFHPHHRWITALPSGNFNVSNGSYSTSNSVLISNSAGVTETSFSTYFTLADLPNVSEFANLYDQYKLKCVVVQIKMINTPEQYWGLGQVSQANPTNFYPTLWYSVDHDDNAVATIAQLKEFSRSKHKVLRPNREINIKIIPTTLQQLYLSAVSTGYACNYTRPWVDMAQTNIPHYGLKMAIDYEGLTTAAANTNVFQFKINAKYYFVCKNAR